MKKSKEDILASLTANTPKEMLPIEVVPEYIGPSHDDIIKDTEEDYAFARAHMKKLIDVSDEAIATLGALCADCEQPKSYEFLSTLIKNSADINNNLMILQRDRKKLIQDKPKETQAGINVGGSITTNNNSIFVGSTIELQKFLKDKQKTIDI